MRIVLDSNILARATPGKSSAAQGSSSSRTRHTTLIRAAPLLTELARVLQNPRVRELHGLDDAGIQTYLQSVQLGSLVVSPLSPPPVATTDPDDDLVLAAPVAGGADVLYTCDRSFYELGRAPGMVSLEEAAWRRPCR